MDSNSLEISIQQKWESNSVEVWLFERTAKGTNFIHSDGTDLIVTFVEEGHIRDNTLLPFLRLPAHFAKVLFKSIADYNSKQGIKTKDENLLEGKLMATTEHLSDMREISKTLLKAHLSLKK